MYFMGAIWLRRGQERKAIIDLTKAGIGGVDAAWDLLRDSGLKLDRDEIPELDEFSSSEIGELWSSIERQRQQRGIVEFSPTQPQQLYVEGDAVSLPRGETVFVVDGDFKVPEGLDAQTTAKLEKLRFSAKTHNDAVEAHHRRMNEGALRIVVFTIAAGIPAYFIGGDMGRAVFLAIWAALYFVTGGF
ncbi:MAG: hypothetical protein B7Y28_23885 [Polaromonas sp. 16-63-31]|nr:MAG: hypothetical protein B7Y28_23885 [Polaromonas sp. 16-63-31]